MKRGIAALGLALALAAPAYPQSTPTATPTPENQLAPEWTLWITESDLNGNILLTQRVSRARTWKQCIAIGKSYLCPADVTNCLHIAGAFIDAHCDRSIETEPLP